MSVTRQPVTPVMQEVTGFTQWYLTVILFICVVASWGSVVAYVKTTPNWNRNIFGRNMVWFIGILAVFLSFYVVRLFWPTMPARVPVLVVLFTLFAVVLVWQLVLFVLIGRDRRRQRRIDKLERLRQELSERGGDSQSS